MKDLLVNFKGVGTLKDEGKASTSLISTHVRPSNIFIQTAGATLSGTAQKQINLAV